MSRKLIYSVAIDSSGQGIIGGIGSANSAYAALISSSGSQTPLIGLLLNGAIYWVTSNDSKMRFIGGKNEVNVYAAFVNPSDSLTPLTNLPLGLNYSVDINSSGNALMGGTSLNLPYAALISPSGVVTTLNGLPNTPGIIYTVKLNDGGTGLISEFSATGPYGAFVAPDGTLTALKGLPAIPEGFLDGTAIHSSGVGIVGGSASNTPFVALAAPNGALTYLNGLPATGQINSIAIALFDDLVPDKIGPFDSFANTQFVLSDVLTQHCMMHPQKRFLDPCCECGREDCGVTFWGTLFGNYVYEKKRHTIPFFSNGIIGALIGFDYKGIQDLTVGAGLAYANNNVHYREKLGHALINQESAVFYATWNKSHFHVNAALWGGLFQTSHKRHSLGLLTSKANPYGWNLSPQLEISTPLLINDCQQFVIDPFVMFDWANNWQYHFKGGASGFNIILKDQYAAIFRSEIGIRFYETFSMDGEPFTIEEKASYVNRTPTHKGIKTASFIGANSSFDVETIGNCSKNLGVAQLHMECLPASLKDVYASFDYQGEFQRSNRIH